MTVLNSDALLTADRDVSMDGKVHLVIMNGQATEKPDSSVLYITKLDRGSLTCCGIHEESKEEVHNAWSSRNMDIGLLYRDNKPEIVPSLALVGGEGEKYQRPSYPSDELGEEKFTCSPDPPTVYPSEITADLLVCKPSHNINTLEACTVDHIQQTDEFDLTHPLISIGRSSAPERWTDPPAKVLVKSSQSIDIHYPDRPRVYSAISSLEESFQIKNNFLSNNGSSKLQRNHSQTMAHSSRLLYVDDGGSRAHNRSQTALADDIIHYEPIKTDHTMNNLDMDAYPNNHHSGILRGRAKTQHLGNSAISFDSTNSVNEPDYVKKKIAFDRNESIIPSAEPQPVEMFRPSCDAYTPRMGHKAIKYKTAAERRSSVDKMSTTMGTIQRPNFRDALRRVSMIIHQHIVKIEKRFELTPHTVHDVGLFSPEMRRLFTEENFVTPRFIVTVLNFPAARSGFQFGKRRIKTPHKIPTVEEIYEFAHQLFNTVQLSSECSIVCLIYVERLMEIAKVPLMSDTWRPIVMCGLLLASKVWQDLSSWNIEFASVYPQFSLSAINRIESQFLKMVKWDLYISSSLYAKYYFALRSLLEKRDFRQKYIRLTTVEQLAASEAIKIQERTAVVKEGVISELSRSM